MARLVEPLQDRELARFGGQLVLALGLAQENPAAPVVQHAFGHFVQHRDQNAFFKPGHGCQFFDRNGISGHE